MNFHHLYLQQNVEPRAFRSLGPRSEAITNQGANLSFSDVANMKKNPPRTFPKNTCFFPLRGALLSRKQVTAGRALFSALTILQCFGHGLKGMTCMADNK